MWWSRYLPGALFVVLLASVPGAARGAPAAGQDSAPVADAADEEADSDAELPGLLIFETDAPSYVYVDGEIKGRVEPDTPLEVRVELGEVEIRAVGIGASGAVWEKTVELPEPGEQTVRIRMGRAIRLWRREERQSAVFRDAKTHLMWPKRDNGSDVDLRRAHAYCGDMETGGFDDWRLPLLEELRSLESIWQRAPYKIKGEILLTECCMWSSEYDGTARAWTFNFRFRQAFQTNAGYAIGLRALCVRPWSPESEPEETKGGAATGEPPASDPGDG